MSLGVMAVRPAGTVTRRVPRWTGRRRRSHELCSNSELATISWPGGVIGLTPSMVAATVPKDNTVSRSTWATCLSLVVSTEVRRRLTRVGIS